jgi:hypothetical protein
MIPGNFREIKIIPNESKEDIYAEANNIENLLNNLIDNFLFEIELNDSKEAKSDIILKFAISFITIHPFGD